MEFILSKIQKASVFVCITVLIAITFFVIATPAHADIFDGLVPCGEMSVSGSSTTGVTTTGECTMCHFQILLHKVLNFLVGIMVAVAALLFANAGVLYVLAPAGPANVSKAHKLFMNTLVGIVIILASWLFVDFLMKALLTDGEINKAGPWNTILCPANSDDVADIGTTYFPGITPTIIVSEPTMSNDDIAAIIDELQPNPSPTPGDGNTSPPHNEEPPENQNPAPEPPQPAPNPAQPPKPLTPEQECADLYNTTLSWFDAYPDDLYEYRAQFDAAGSYCSSNPEAATQQIINLRQIMADDVRIKDEPCWVALESRQQDLLVRAEATLACANSSGCSPSDITQITASITRIRYDGYSTCAQANAQYDADISNINKHASRCGCSL